MRREIAPGRHRHLDVQGHEHRHRRVHRQRKSSSPTTTARPAIRATTSRPRASCRATSGNDGILSPGEMWIYTASDAAEDSRQPAPRARSTSPAAVPSRGTAGNIRTFTAGGVSVKTSAFSRDTSGVWSTAYLGSYGGGLGVTDSSEERQQRYAHRRQHWPRQLRAVRILRDGGRRLGLPGLRRRRQRPDGLDRHQHRSVQQSPDAQRRGLWPASASPK